MISFAKDIFFFNPRVIPFDEINCPLALKMRILMANKYVKKYMKEKYKAGENSSYLFDFRKCQGPFICCFMVPVDCLNLKLDLLRCNLHAGKYTFFLV